VNVNVNVDVGYGIDCCCCCLVGVWLGVRCIEIRDGTSGF
jgi:hypothetical protein